MVHSVCMKLMHTRSGAPKDPGFSLLVTLLMKSNTLGFRALQVHIPQLSRFHASFTNFLFFPLTCS